MPSIIASLYCGSDGIVWWIMRLHFCLHNFNQFWQATDWNATSNHGRVLQMALDTHCFHSADHLYMNLNHKFQILIRNYPSPQFFLRNNMLSYAYFSAKSRITNLCFFQIFYRWKWRIRNKLFVFVNASNKVHLTICPFIRPSLAATCSGYTLPFAL